MSSLLRAASVMPRMTSAALAAFSTAPVNEPVLGYRKGSPELAKLQTSLAKFQATVTKVPIVIGDEEIHSDDVRYQVMPFDHSKKLAQFSYANESIIKKAIDTGLKAREAWSRRPLEERCGIMFKAAELLQEKYRYDINAATILGQGKTIIQAEVDAACELIDFLKFNAANALALEKYNPISPAGVKNSMTYRGLEGFVASIAPFNFTAIGGNLAACPAMMGNVVLLKPSDTAVLSNYIAFQVLREAGVPAGVINFIPADGPTFGNVVTASPDLACVNFTGSVPTFQTLWKLVAQNLEKYKTFPRLIGECGGKNFHFVHKSADVDSVVNGAVRSAFEYSGQKCSACSRMFVPASLWPTLRTRLQDSLASVKCGSPLDVDSFTSAVIDERAFERLSKIQDRLKQNADKEFEIVAGGDHDNSKGYFIQPTIVEVKNPKSTVVTEEYFGPILPVVVYPDDKADEVVAGIKDATPFGLTGAVFAQDPEFTDRAVNTLRDAVGNLYINDKSTGSVVGQQPFGGARKSGTNDKAGGPHYVLKFASPLTTKESFTPLTEIDYPYMRQ